MKKLTIILLLMCYIVPIVGITVSTHYCGGKRTSVSFQFSGLQKCACGSKKMKKDCCKTKICTFSTKEVQEKAPQLAFNLKNLFSLQPAIIDAYSKSTIATTDNASFYTKQDPPDLLKQPLYLSNRIFRI